MQNSKLKLNINYNWKSQQLFNTHIKIGYSVQQRRRAIEALEARAPPDSIATVVNSLFILKKLSF